MSILCCNPHCSTISSETVGSIKAIGKVVQVEPSIHISRFGHDTLMLCSKKKKKKKTSLESVNRFQGNWYVKSKNLPLIMFFHRKFLYVVRQKNYFHVKILILVCPNRTCKNFENW